MRQRKMQIKDATGINRQISNAEYAVLRSYNPDIPRRQKVLKTLSPICFAIFLGIMPSTQVISSVDASEIIKSTDEQKTISAHNQLNLSATALESLTIANTSITEIQNKISRLYVQVEFNLAD